MSELVTGCDLAATHRSALLGHVEAARRSVGAGVVQALLKKVAIVIQ